MKPFVIRIMMITIMKMEKKTKKKKMKEKMTRLMALKKCFQLPGQSLREFSLELKELKERNTPEEYEAFCDLSAEHLGAEIG